MLLGCRMSSSEFKLASVVSVTSSTSSPPSKNSDDSPKQPTTNPTSHELVKSMLVTEETKSPEPSDSSPNLVIDVPSQVSNTPPELDLPSEYSTTASFNYLCDNPRQPGRYIFTSDGNFTAISLNQMLDMKDLDKGDPSGVILAGRPLNTSSLLASSNASPKPFATIHLSETKNDKMISDFEGRVDGLSPLSVISVSAYQETCHASPSLQSGMLARSHPVLRYHPGSDTMLSALNYNDSDMLQDGGFDVPSSSSFGSLDGLLSSGMVGGNGTGMRLPDLLDSEINQETYIETAQDLQLSPQSFHTTGETFSVSENASLGSLNEANEGIIISVTRELKPENNIILVDKLKVKNTRPVKATSPSRPGNNQPCPTCGKVFSNSSALTKHKLTHSDERKYVCPLCAKAFKRQDHLNGHMLTHRNKKPYECDAEGCGKSYCDARSLRRHKENHHSTPSTTTSSQVPVSMNKQVTMISGLGQIPSFTTLQSSFPASVITSNSSSPYVESTTISNRIQYAPPPATTASVNAAQVADANSNSLSKTTESSVVSTIVPSTVSELQYLGYRSPAQSSSESSSSMTKTDKTSWSSQTINTGALMLGQDVETSQHKPKSAQISAGSFSSSRDQGKIGVSSATTIHLPEVKVENFDEQSSSLERPPSTDIHTKNVESSLDRDSNHQTTLKVASNKTLNGTDNMLSHTTGTFSKREADCITVDSPLLQQLLNQHQTAENGNRISQTYPDLSFISSLPEQETSSSTTTAQPCVIPQWPQIRYAVPNSVGLNRPISQSTNQDPKPVECSLCQRKFKNIPALNGHMRLHGGYFKKELEAKKAEKKAHLAMSAATHSPLITASTNVRALIEEKIIQKRNTISQSIPTTVIADASPPVQQVFDFADSDNLPKHEPVIKEERSFLMETSPVMSPIVQETSVFDDFPVSSQSSTQYDSNTSFTSTLFPDDWLKKNDLKFRVPRPPGEKYRRHSDSDHFIPSKKPCTSYTNSALADLLRRKVVAKRTCRTGSDPGDLLPFDTLAFGDLTTGSLAQAFDFLPKFSTDASLPTSLEDSLQRDIVDSATDEEAALPILSAEDIPDAQPAMEGLKDDIDSNCLDKSVFFDTSSTSLPVSQPFPDISVSELEIMQLTTTVTSIASMPPCEINAQTQGRICTGEDSNDDDVFLSPTSLPTSPMKTKRKRRPEPLYIPPYVNTCGFTSRLRSPRLWDPSHPEHKKLSPPPYTPPPMLSPVRSGSGLFWHIISASGSLTPKSAPHTPSFGYPHKGSVGDVTVEEEEIFHEPPETDIQPHVNIGPYYQAKLPVFNSNIKDALYAEHKADKVWDPCFADILSEEEVESYLEFACSSAVPGGGRNKEYAFHLLRLCKGKIEDAVLSLMDTTPKLPSNNDLLSFSYAESDKWTAEESEAYHQGMLKCDKDFYSIAKEIPGKSVKQCIQFYYLWKKVCPDEYKRIRVIRRRKEQESLYYNLRNKEEEEENQLKTENHISDISQAVSEEEDTLTGKDFSDRKETNEKCSSYVSTKVRSRTSHNGPVTQPTTGSVYEFPIEPFEEFPCKVCGKIFNKIKSRSAHMKTHRPPEVDRKPKHDFLDSFDKF